MANPSRGGDAKPGTSLHREAARLPKAQRYVRISEREICEDDPGTAVAGHHDAGRHGVDRRRRNAVAGLMKDLIRNAQIRLFLALTSLASLALVVEAGQRWQR